MTTDPEATSSYLLCRYLQYGCHWSARWLPGGESRAQAQRRAHEEGCIYRFHAPKTTA